MPIQTKRSFQGAKFDNTPRNNWKPLFEVNFNKNSTKTIRLFALDFYEVIVDEAFIEIEREGTWCLNHIVVIYCLSLSYSGLPLFS